MQLTRPVREGSEIPIVVPPSDKPQTITVEFQKRKGQSRIVIHAPPEVIAANLIDATSVSAENT